MTVRYADTLTPFGRLCRSDRVRGSHKKSYGVVRHRQRVEEKQHAFIRARRAKSNSARTSRSSLEEAGRMMYTCIKKEHGLLRSASLLGPEHMG